MKLDTQVRLIVGSLIPFEPQVIGLVSSEAESERVRLCAGEAFNCATSNLCTYNALVELCGKAAGREATIKYYNPKVSVVLPQLSHRATNTNLKSSYQTIIRIMQATAL